MAEEKIRLGGMALANGVLVHGPTSWACAIRTDDGQLKVVARRKRLLGRARSRARSCAARSRLLDAMAIIPQIRHALPGGEAAVPAPCRARGDARQRDGREAAARARASVGPAAQELVGGLLSLAPAALALRGSDVAAYHGAEHISIGSYEQGKRATKEHDRCGSHLLGPLLVTTGDRQHARGARPGAPARARTLGAQLVAVAASTEIFGWMVRNPEKRLARALAKPGHELQHRLATAEPSPEQLEVAEAALAACLELERE